MSRTRRLNTSTKRIVACSETVFDLERMGTVQSNQNFLVLLFDFFFLFSGSVVSPEGHALAENARALGRGVVSLMCVVTKFSYL